MKEQYERALGEVMYLNMYLRESTKEMDSINTRNRDISYNLEGTRLDLLEAQSKLETRELETRKVRSNMDDAIISLHIEHQEGCRRDLEVAVINGHGAVG